MCENLRIMQALLIHGNKDIRIEDIPVPEPAPDEALLRVAGSSICATDIEEWQYGPLWAQQGAPNPISGRQIPLVLGHEITGTVELPVGGLAEGTRVVVNNVRTCGECFWCRRGAQATCPNMCVAGLSADGGLAEYMTWPASHLIPLPDSISSTEAPLLEPATVAVHAVRRSGVKVGDNVAVIGCGTVGLLAIQAYKASGARVIAVDVRDQSLKMAERLGADDVLDSSRFDAVEALAELTSGIGPDIVTETAGAAETPRLAIQSTRPGGTTVLVGIYTAVPKFNFNDIVGPERTIIGSVAAAPGDMEAAVRLVAESKVQLKELVSAVIPLSRVVEEGFERMIQPEKDVFRIVVTPDG